MSLARILATASREARELWRDRFRLWSALLMPAVLFVVLGFGLSLDVEGLRYAVLDRDGTPASRAYLEPFLHSSTFAFRGAHSSWRELDRALVSGDLALAIDVPKGFHRDLSRGRPPEIAFWIDGTLPFRANVAAGYVSAMHRSWMEKELAPRAAIPTVETRFLYNPALRSALSFAPGLIAVLLAMFSPIVSAMAMAREKELGTMVNLYSTPLRGAELLVAKQLPFAALTFLQFLLLLALSVSVFGVSLRGDVTSLLLLAALYACALTGLGTLIGTLVRSQIEALLITLVLTMLPAWLFTGFFSPVASLPNMVRVVSQGFPATYFLHACVSVLAKGLGWSAVARDALALAAFALALTLLAVSLLREQAR